MLKDFRHEGETVAVAPMADFYVTAGLGKDEIRIAYVLGVPELKKAARIIALGIAAYNKRKGNAAR